LLDEQGDELFATTDAIAERARKIGGTTLRSIAHISRLQRIQNRHAEHAPAIDMLAELGRDNKQVVVWTREHDVCDEHGDVASGIWFLFEATRADGRRRSAAEIWFTFGGNRRAAACKDAG
jgi:starvation-inducible DNA-binding protein